MIVLCRGTFTAGWAMQHYEQCSLELSACYSETYLSFAPKKSMISKISQSFFGIEIGGSFESMPSKMQEPIKTLLAVKKMDSFIEIPASFTRCQGALNYRTAIQPFFYSFHHPGPQEKKKIFCPYFHKLPHGLEPSGLFLKLHWCVPEKAS